MSERGGNKVETWDFNSEKDVVFEKKPYVYKLIHLNGRLELTLKQFSSFTIYVFESETGILADDNIVVSNEVIHADRSSCELKGKGVLLLSGVLQDLPRLQPKLKFFKETEIKKVIKPWGHELWLNGEHPGYAFKQIFIKAGTKTSLQYHRLKSETNVLFEGQAKLHYKKNLQVANDLVCNHDLASCELKPGMSIGVKPLTLHRIEAVTDITLYEVSTPHLDDVVRVADDQNRPHGRIENEHSARALTP